jgi:hypothetical protein
MNQIKNLTDTELQVLTNFSQINKNIVFRKGKIQKTMSGMKDILCEYKFETEIPIEFGLYDLKEFLDYYDFFKNPIIKVNKNRLIINDDELKSEYCTSDFSILVYPRNDIITDNFYEFDLSKEQLKKIKKYKSKSSLPDTSILNEEGELICKLLDKKNHTTNSINLKLNRKTNHNFNLYLKSDHLDKILIANYKVQVSTRRIIKLMCKDIPLIYWIALEKDSNLDTK